MGGIWNHDVPDFQVFWTSKNSQCLILGAQALYSIWTAYFEFLRKFENPILAIQASEAEIETNEVQIDQSETAEPTDLEADLQADADEENSEHEIPGLKIQS